LPFVMIKSTFFISVFWFSIQTTILSQFDSLFNKRYYAPSI
jgi:hypothetical protein